MSDAVITDPLAPYRQIEGLFVVGPAELDRLFRLEAEGNPLELEPSWVREVPVPPECDEWLRSKHWLTESWETRAVLTLVPPKVGNIPTSLAGLYQLLGVPHDGREGGIIRQDVFWSNWFVNQPWANEPAVTEWEWLLVYEHPLWTTEKSWTKQQEAAQEKGMPIATVALDTWALNMAFAVYGVRLRNTTWSRTSTIVGGSPLEVGSPGDSVRVPRRWLPGYAYGSVAASVRGVPTLGL